MNVSAVYRLALPLGLLLLVLCATGNAIKCYQCGEWTDKGCKTAVTCPNEDGCMKVTEGTNNLSLYQCRNYNTCNSKTIKGELGLSKILLNCCNSNLCNRGLADLPVVGLILSLASALVALFI